MCYMILLSTDITEDLSLHNNSLITFPKNLPPLAEVNLLAYPHRWFVGSAHGCSCGFRHLYSVELGFSRPEDWLSEESQDIEATLHFVRIVRDMLKRKVRVDCIDDWGHESDSAEFDGTLEVNLSQITDQEFRFFENYRFIFCNEI